ALAEGDLAHGHGGPGSGALQADDHALEDLDALALGLLGLALDLFLDRALLDPHVDAHGVARVEAGQPLLQVPGLDAVDRIHCLIPRLMVCRRTPWPPPLGMRPPRGTSD